ncbi:MAG: hypothetical protein PVF98_09690, partial [Desulfobacterales bacterium]
MEENQITCPQCGLANDILADACVQCGIIFVKDPAMIAAAAALDDAKRKSIEAAEAILDETQPPEALAALDNEAIKRPDPHEDTVEIRIPRREELPPVDAQLPDSEPSKPEEPKDEQKSEIDLESIETALETVIEPMEGEAPNLTDAKADEPAKPTADATAEKPDEPASDFQKTANESTEADNSVSTGKDSPDSKADEPAAKESKAESMATEASSESLLNTESEKKQTAPEASVESEAANDRVAEPAKAEDDLILTDDIQPD